MSNVTAMRFYQVTLSAHLASGSVAICKHSETKYLINQRDELLFALGTTPEQLARTANPRQNSSNGTQRQVPSKNGSLHTYDI
jgi:hypothetical protein